MVLEANTPAGKIYNLVIFGAILLSVVVLLFEPNPLGNSALQQTEVLWIDLVQDSCLAVFAGDFVLHLAVVPSPRKYLFSFTGLIDLSAVLFFFVPQVRSELLLWVFKFGRILRVFKLLKFIDKAKVLAQALRGSARTICVFLFFVFLRQVVLGYAIGCDDARLRHHCHPHWDPHRLRGAASSKATGGIDLLSMWSTRAPMRRAALRSVWGVIGRVDCGF